MKFLDEPNLL